MRARTIYACAAMLALVSVALSSDGAPARKDSSVRLPGAIEFVNPDPGAWEWTSGVRCLMYSPRAVALLIDGKRDAIIRFHLFNAADSPPSQVAADFRMIFARDGWSFDIIRDGGKSGETVIVFSDNQAGGIRGKLTVKLLPGNPKLTVLTLGVWRESDSAALTKDFDAAARSVKWCPPKQ